MTESVIGNALELSDRQKKRIRDKSDTLAEEIKDFISETRQKAHDIVFDTLSEKQTEKLLDAFSERQFTLLFEQTNIQIMYQQLLYRESEHSIFRTKVERKLVGDKQK